MFFLTAVVAFAHGNGLWEIFCDKRRCETGPGIEVAEFDGSEKCGWHRTEDRSVEESCYIGFCLSRADDSASYIGRSG